ncbi:hypothetical protein T07_11352 [Trichinella nelsoni]|uniref:Uncharacterized protein n=1 Tax=Trichinella nelsoni TaxID=6336 RepID=A0A0V0RME0_9BILA|nr:hypothetical protein T07_11352 [Trichinella nelsoni]
MAVKQPTDSVLKTDYEDRKVRLPRLNLPKFDGDVTRFREFLDQFEVSVHHQVDLSNATKLAYFRGCLITIEYGVALDAFRGLSAANQGYELAVQRLKERFDRPLVAVRAHILRFFHNLNRSFDLSAICQPECRALSSGGATVSSLCHRIPVSKILTGEWEHLQFLDPTFDDSSDEVHVMIGIDYYYRFLGNAIRRGRPSDPVAVETVLEWIICGPVNPRPVPKTVAAFSAAVEMKEIEGIEVSSKSESDALDPEKRFRKELLYDGNRYSVRLLWKKNEWNLPDNFAVAKAVSRHSNDGWPESHHDAFFHSAELLRDWFRLRRSRRKDPRDAHPTLDPGPKLKADLLGILLRFRRYRVALQSDIVKMFLQVDLREEDRDVCRFLWRKDEAGGFLATYRLTRIEKRDCFRTVVDEIKAGTYVDDLVVSCHTITEAKDFVRRSSELLGSGGFHLAKWASNAPEALVDRPTDEILRNRHSRLGKTIGISWNPQEDERLIDELTYDKRFELRS